MSKLMFLGGITLVILNSFARINTSAELQLKSFYVPVLINLDDNPVLKINLNLNSDSVSVKSFVFNLKETTDLNNIKALRVCYAGGDSVYNPNNEIELFGQIKKANGALNLKGMQPLIKGNIFFYVSVELIENSSLSNTISVELSKVIFRDNTYLKPNPDNNFKSQRIGVALRNHLDDNADTYRIPGLATTNKGTLLAIYDVRWDSARNLQGDMDIGLSRSADGGQIWEPMKIVLDMNKWGSLPEKFNSVSDACFLVDENTNDIYVAGLWMHGVLDENGRWISGLTEESNAWEHQWRRKGSQQGFGVKETSQFLIAKSTDDGVTWSEPRNLTSLCKKEEWWLWAPAPGQGITMENGTLVFPTQGRDQNGQSFSNISFSLDGGDTWETSQPAFKNTTENMVVQLANGDLMLNARYNLNWNNLGDDNGRVILTTADMGQTWTEHPTSRSALIESTCRASLHKHVYHENGEEKNILLFSNPNSRTSRNNMTIKVSFDNGQSWPEKYWMLLDEGYSYGYSCLTSIDENTIGILYEGGRADMVFERITLEELLFPELRNN